MTECIVDRKKTRHGSATDRILRMSDEIYFSDLGLARGGPILSFSLKATEALPMISRRASALKQVLQDLVVKILMTCGSDPNNIMMETGRLIASAWVVGAQNWLTILSSRTVESDERLGRSHAEIPPERIPTASPW
jgi:hypothetical protein